MEKSKRELKFLSALPDYLLFWQCKSKGDKLLEGMVKKTVLGIMGAVTNEFYVKLSDTGKKRTKSHIFKGLIHFFIVIEAKSEGNRLWEVMWWPRNYDFLSSGVATN